MHCQITGQRGRGCGGSEGEGGEGRPTMANGGGYDIVAYPPPSTARDSCRFWLRSGLEQSLFPFLLLLPRPVRPRRGPRSRVYALNKSAPSFQPSPSCPFPSAISRWKLHGKWGYSFRRGKSDSLEDHPPRRQSGWPRGSAYSRE